MADKPKPALEADKLAALVDEYGLLDGELSAFTKTKARRDEVAKLLRAAAGWAHPEIAVTYTGAKFKVVLGPAANETHLAPIARIYRALGRVTFLEVATVTLKALKEHVHPDVVKRITQVDRTGTRPIDVQPSAPIGPEVQAAA